MASNIERQMHNIGLNQSESQVYLYLLEHGLSGPPEISKGTKIARSNAHNVLKELVVKGLVNRQQKGKRYVYIPKDPGATLALLDKKRDALEDALPDLYALHKKLKNKPSIKFYEGVDELKEIFEATLLAEEKEILGFASTKKLFTVLPKYFETQYQKLLKKKEIFFRDILTHASGEKEAKETKENVKPYYDYRLLKKEVGDLPTDVLIWDDNVAIMTLEDPVFGTIITNQDVADTFREMFNLAWQKVGEE